ncbi:helicase HerA-like domain-containing protein [Cellulomonas flavigena]|uniref:helicase HerA-like domain-containing protein n=1 Tax=Cellulomonas flavigena TaxID=1711 RepID=UPI0002E562B0|nr:helicase HerA-like domain-containing protein [Cellulomonas flavigena]
MADSTQQTPEAARLAELEAQAARAAADAAEARAQAAEAQAAAAAAAAELAAARQTAGTAPGAAPTSDAGPASHTGGTAASPAPEAPTAPADATSVLARTVTAGYTFEGPVLPLGVLLEDGSPVRAARVGLPLGMLNRHGLVAGATGTGKTRTLQLMTEGLSTAGVPVFVADVKGDLTGLAEAGASSEKLLARTTALGQDWTPTAFPVELYALGGLGDGVPVRTTVTDFGPLLLAKVLGLNATQESSLGLVFHWADQQGLALLDLADLRTTLQWLTSDEGKAELKGIGGLSSATAGVILREIVALQGQGADAFFGEPAFEVSDLLRTAADGRGVVSALELPAVQDRPALFSTFLMWLLAELFEVLPEVGDLDKPRLVFFFDEAHLLFTDASKDFLAEVVRTVRLIRSKGVGIVFVTQSPKDVPADVLAQLGSRVQHALRAFTPEDAKALRAAARTYPSSDYDLEQVLQQLGTGEAVVTVLSEKGAPTPVAWTRLYAPRASMAPAPASTVQATIAASSGAARYASPVDRESAHELLTARMARSETARAQAAAEQEAQQEAARKEKDEQRSARTTTRSRSRVSKPLDSFLRSAGTQLGREITRTIFGTRRR